MKMTEYQRALVEQHLSVVDWVIRCRINVSSRPLLTYEDFYQIGCEALCHAAMNYDQQKGSFEVFGSRYVYNAMIDHCRKQNGAAARSVNLLIDEDGDADLFQFGSEIPDYDAIVFGRQLRKCLSACKSRYSGVALRGIEAIELKNLGFSTREIANQYGTTVNNVNAWISRARSKLRNDPELQTLFS